MGAWGGAALREPGGVSKQGWTCDPEHADTARTCAVGLAWRGEETALPTVLLEVFHPGSAATGGVAEAATSNHSSATVCTHPRMLSVTVSVTGLSAPHERVRLRRQPHVSVQKNPGEYNGVSRCNVNV